ncbi:DUF2157 domain-containing protein [Campylobacter sp. faydin G-140]|uniref:DUF2157 domain-containing protein n=1 Tax=Campylobacter anatolicus TaxID=2829105 RepID=UPI001BA116ED|nr:DUF2157 domain-containing protein [Campylobacter anatolicus]MBR8465838.1 DUF2157 domain-containing protein [Campylobacter anatolicus]
MNIFYKNFLATELSKWQENGIVDEHTAYRIAKQYDIDTIQSSSSNFILKLVAYLFLALSFITLIGANWEEIPRGARLLLVLSMVGLVNFGGYFNLKKGNKTAATGLFFLGNLCYGAAIALIAQIYNLGEHMPNGVLLWAVGAFVLSLATTKSVLVAQSLILSFIWFNMELDFNSLRYEFGIFIAFSIFALFKESSRLLIFAIFISIYAYIITILSHISFDRYHYYFFFGGSVVFLSMSYSLLGVATAYLLSHFKRYKDAEFLLKLSLLCGIAILLFANLDFYGDMQTKIIFYKNWLGLLHLAFIALTVVVAIKLKREILLWIGAILLVLPYVIYLLSDYSQELYSLLSVLVGVFLIKKCYITQGLCVIFIVALIRYIDLLGDYIGASMLFLLFAIILLVVSKKRSIKAKQGAVK